jgi:glycerophosphoryl diester phosphodiesterase
MPINNRSAALARGQPHGAGIVLDRAAFLRPIAHRGLHDNAKGRLENTAPAFLAAIRKGYGIECDLRAAADATPMVFHDATLDRLVAASGPIRLRSPVKLARLRYKNQNTGILTFAGLLELVDGAVPLLVEVKSNGRPRMRFLEKIAALAESYRGPIALMSFDRRTVMALGQLAPALPRGLVVGAHQVRARLWVNSRKRGGISPVAAFLEAAPPGLAFFAVDVNLVQAAAAWMATRPARLPLFSWTIRTPPERALAAKWADAAIFEGYEP